ncbi:hypothetical protein [Paenarthrobacter aurescens]|uniref:Lipoprotein n=1 Tax=Paenarthrobacter aurescens TaxID=43663 RepID=A0A4Y3NIE4_PAEAU|nr:hypothetical protein [Paenarthrobacter aurescens]MDO6143948.1 hypothetical protein [Paenarthrobacter aurescens]MDO6147795.1 hypothetical protein [Paenarthrobacter aurescens]MDO6159039.1 hypothetical protein [Paenarthrobacter aurescens]MDO6163023.1 hypothetical protein [Paenarthrobacter aurescens]GEB18499.1 hypothetical protein AAU01_12540 [Paenarthrobacter aurescens]
MNGTLNLRSTAKRLAAISLAVAFIAGTAACTAENKGPQVTSTDISRPNTSESGSATPEATTPASGAAGGSPSATPTETDGSTVSASPGASPAATAVSWKTYTDSAKTVSFELPQEWIAQSVTPEAGSLPNAVKVEVKDAEGRYLATLHTGLPTAAPASCPPGEARPYVVISSVPLDIPHSDGPDTIDPRVVFRVVQGYKFFGSYGITNMVAGVDGQSCELRNRVLGPAGKGDISFGDVPAIHAFAADEKVAPAKAFDTLDLAAKYAVHGSEFANVQRMLLSLKVNL